MQKKTRKAKFIKFCHTAADKTGKAVRRARPWIGGALATVAIILVKGGKGGSKDA